ncbi:autophagy-related protein 16 [Diaporthe sp. PMI_573]|nr:autophagy-related protein 16 [Diaporthaceae sp. PMI_573]
MPGWKEEYLSSILEAEKSNPVNQELVEACSLLNDRIAALEAEKAHWQSSTPTPSNAPQQQTPTKVSSATSSSAAATDPAQSRLRTDLAEALRQKSSLEARLRKTTSERDALQATQRSQARAVRDLSGERDALRLRVGDQAEELRGKKHMLEQVQDEVLALEMQLNVAEQQKAKIAAENKQLIERWMRRARQEADDMNAANEKRGDGP